MMKKITSLLVLFCLLSTAVSGLGSPSGFWDVNPTDWFYTDVTALAGLGVIEGYRDGAFRPQGQVTAAEFYKLFVTAVDPLLSLPEDAPWHAPYEAWLLERGLLETQTLQPYAAITKIEIAGLLARYYPDGDYPAALTRLGEGFLDYADIPQESRRDALRMCYDGLIVGSGGRYGPGQPLTRAEAATVIARVLDETRRQPVPIPALPVDGLKATATSGQIITVTVPTAKSYKATVNAYEAVDGVWQRVYRDLAGVTGGQGVMKNRKQGTYTSPVGNYGFVFAFGAKENPGMNPAWAYRDITADSYWVLDGDSPLYNRWTEGRGSFRSYERLVDFGYQYNYAMVIDFNYDTPVKGDGGAIFLHVKTNDGKGTGGCIGLREEDLVNIMRWLDPGENPRIIICVEEELASY